MERISPEEIIKAKAKAGIAYLNQFPPKNSNEDGHRLAEDMGIAQAQLEDCQEKMVEITPEEAPLIIGSLYGVWDETIYKPLADKIIAKLKPIAEKK